MKRLAAAPAARCCGCRRWRHTPAVAPAARRQVPVSRTVWASETTAPRCAIRPRCRAMRSCSSRPRSHCRPHECRSRRQERRRPCPRRLHTQTRPKEEGKDPQRLGQERVTTTEQSRSPAPSRLSQPPRHCTMCDLAYSSNKTEERATRRPLEMDGNRCVITLQQSKETCPIPWSRLRSRTYSLIPWLRLNPVTARTSAGRSERTTSLDTQATAAGIMQDRLQLDNRRLRNPCAE